MESKKASGSKREVAVDERPVAIMIAKKDWHVVHNEIDVKIKAGEEIPTLPAGIMQALKTENVI